MKKQQLDFIKSHNLTENQFLGKEKIGGYLDLRSLTSIPEGFNPTVGGDLDLSSLTSIPEGFNPTVGGSLYLKNSKKRIGCVIDETKLTVEINKNFFWNKNGREYAKIDGIFCEIISKKNTKINDSEALIISAKKVNKKESFYIANKANFYAHGDDIKKAIEDLNFKEASAILKKEPIYEDTVITVNHYRIITGACQLGCDQWMKQNNISSDKILAKDLLPLLEKTNAYGFERFKKLIKF